MIPPLPSPRTDPSDEGVREASRVAAYLAVHPRFLAENPGLYRGLHPPRRVHGEALADHMAALLAAARAETVRLAERARADHGWALRAGGAVLALLGTAEPEAVVAEEWPALLGLETAALAEEGPPGRCRRGLPPGTVARLLGGADLALRAAPRDMAAAPLLHGEAHPLVQRDALLRLPGAAPRLLVLGARVPADLPESGAAPLRLLAAALARALEARAVPPG